jgi:hypothetical protein
MNTIRTITLPLLLLSLILGYLGAHLSSGACVLMAILISACAAVSYQDQERK